MRVSLDFVELVGRSGGVIVNIFVQALHLTFEPWLDAKLFDTNGNNVSAAGDWRLVLQYDGSDSAYTANVTITQ